MTISVDSLMTPETTDAQLEKFLVSLESLGLKPRDWKQGGALRTILKVVASVYAGFTSFIVALAKSAFLSEATGGWLTLLAYYVYGVSRIEATFATGQVRLTNTGGGVYSIPIGSLQVANPATGKVYTNLAIISLNPGNVVTADVRAVEIGTSSNSSSGTVTQIQSVLPGVVCTNLLPISGVDEEKDEDLRQRCLDRLGTISGLGPRGAYSYAVKSAVRGDGTPVDVNRVRISPSSSTGIVTVVVASAAGAPVPSDLPYIAASIEKYARPDTVTVNLVSATNLPVTLTPTVWAKRVDGLDAAGLADLIQAKLIALASSYPIGGIAKPPSTSTYLYADNLIGTIKTASDTIFDVDGISADIAMTEDQVPVITATLDIRLIEVST